MKRRVAEKGALKEDKTERYYYIHTLLDKPILSHFMTIKEISPLALFYI